MKRILLSSLIALAFFSSSQNAEAYTPGQFRISGLLGQVGLLGDVGDSGANGVGLGVGAAYQLDENFGLDIRFTGSSHSEVAHRDLSVGGEYYFGDYTNAYPHVVAGMSFLSNELKNRNISGDAVGIYIGGGLAFELSRHIQIGPELRFVKAFESERKVGNETVTTVGDNYSLLLRLQYVLGDD